MRWLWVSNFEYHLISALVLSLAHMPQIARLASGDSVWAQGGKEFSGKSLESPPGLLYCIIIAMCSVWLEGVGTSVDLEKMRGCISISFTCFHLSKRKTFVVRWNFVLM